MTARSTSVSPPATEPGRWLERLSLWHAAVLAVAITWGFGGNIDWIRLPLALWSSLAALLIGAGLLQRHRQQQGGTQRLLWLLPWVALTTLTWLASTNPSYRVTAFFETPVYRPVAPAISWLPSSARPDLARVELWLLSGLYLTGFNLVLNIRRRRRLRQLFGLLAANAALLAVFGTVQKLTDASGLYFGAQPSPNPAFFASFIYKNHWSAFALLLLPVLLALAWYQFDRDNAQPFMRTPGPLLLLAALLLAATIPLSGSRSGTLLLFLYVIGLAVAAYRRRQDWANLGVRARIGLIAGAALALGGVVWLTAPAMSARLDKTREQLEEWREVGGLGGREILYRDTWRMARERPWTGWGLESYETVFVRFNSATSPHDHLRVHFDQAHSDWLQAMAELGAIGTCLLLLMALVPLWSLRAQWSHLDAIPCSLLSGCGLIVLYATIEFPLANPAVVALFWILFFGALRYLQLSARPTCSRS